jgi:hypothetical protein
MTSSQHYHASRFLPRKVHRPPVIRPRGFHPRLEGLEDRTVPSTLTVSNNLDSGEGSLRAAIKSAGSGDTIVFASGLSGQTITLTGGELAIKKGLDIEGPGADNLAVSGNDTDRVFDIVSEGLTVRIAGLTIAHGLAKGGEAGGGGIQNVGSTLTVANDILSYNTASNRGNNDGLGGAVYNYNGAALIVINSQFIRNQAIAGDGAIGRGGAIENSQATVTVTGSTFTGNRAVGGNGGVFEGSDIYVGMAIGGAIHNNQGTLTVTDSTFTGNEAIAGSGGSGGAGAAFGRLDVAQGGAIDDSTEGTLYMSRCLLAYNRAVGGSNATGSTSGDGRVGGGYGGGLWVRHRATVTDCTFDHNMAQGGSGNVAGSNTLAGDGSGGAIGVLIGTLTSNNLTLTNNQAVGGVGNTGSPFAGDGIGGGVAALWGAAVTLSDSTVSGNQAVGGQGPAVARGANGLGGGFANILGSTLTVSGSMVSGNEAIGGAGATGANGGASLGGGLYNDGPSIALANAGTPATVTVTGSTITDNQATGGTAGTSGSVGLGEGGGLYLADGGAACLDMFTQANTKNNHATTDHDDIFGSFTTC